MVLYNETTEQYPGTYGSHDQPVDESHCTEEEDITNPRQASQQRGHGGQSTAEDTDEMGRNGARLLENPMYAVGVLQQDDGGSLREDETKQESPGTDEFHQNPGNDVYHCIGDDERTSPRQASHQSGHGGQPTAEDTDKTGRNGDLLQNQMYAAGVLRQDDGEPVTNTRRSGHDGHSTAEDTDKTGRNGARLLENPMYAAGVLPQDDGVVAAVIGAGAGLVTFLTTVKETHPPTHNSSLERSGTSSRPVSPFPTTPTDSTLENKNGNLSS
ncbi:uncharacterized protein LOC118420179 [Branchiostoma floridae]|uniref:Uncharacterized protein LOC118420179 n=1 Tax=Branchiostoma floridae TaxID=7739 RepID=A0A9J7MXX7_BRAFL|nr:uncharacterized protein LOC118420179 [Branchiostoma floridae]